MTPLPRNTILLGHALDLLQSLPDGCVHCVVTSPPYYGLRAYDTEPQIWDGLSDCQHVWGETARAPWANDVPGPHGRAKNTEAGHWKTKETGPFCQRCGAWRGELGQEPTPALYIAHLVRIFREVGRVMRHDASLWVNLGDSYSGDSPIRHTSAETFSVAWDPSQSRGNGGSRRSAARQGTMRPKSLLLIPQRFAIAMADEGWIVRSDIIWAKGNALPESVTDRPTKSHEYVFLLTKNERYFYDAQAIAEPTSGTAHPRGRGVHPKTTESGQGIKANRSWEAATVVLAPTRNARTVWEINAEPFSGAHFATMPGELARRCILAGSAERCCEICGAPWKRVIEKITMYAGHSAQAGCTALLAQWPGWPARPGQPQYDGEPPRTTTQTLPHRVDQLHALGNGVVWQTLAPVFVALQIAEEIYLATEVTA